MALDTYDNLVKAIIDQAHRGSSLNTKIDQFIVLAEEGMRSNPEKPLKMRLSEATATGTTSIVSAFTDLPVGYQSSRSLRITLDLTTNNPIYKTPADLFRRQGTGTPCFYTIIGEQIEWDILPDDAYTVTFQYWKDFTPLSTANQSNEVLAKYPSIYLYGGLKQAMIYSDDDERAIKYDGLFSAAILSANKAEKKGRFGDTPQMAVRWSP